MNFTNEETEIKHPYQMVKMIKLRILQVHLRELDMFCRSGLMFLSKALFLNCESISTVHISQWLTFL